MRVNSHLWLYISSTFAVIADLLLIIYSKSKNSAFFILIIACIISLLSCICWSQCMKMGIKCSTAITLYSLLTILSCTFIGVLFFKEEINLKGIIGIILALIAIILI